MFSKKHIIAEIRRTATENDGKPLGGARLEAETGIAAKDILKYWARLGDAHVEAGFTPNRLQGPRSDGEILEKLALFVRELGRFPVANEIKLRARTQKGFPWHNTLAKFGGKSELASVLRDYCLKRSEFKDVVEICNRVVQETEPIESDMPASADDTQLGFVYLLKSGRFYKIGKTNAVGRRERELAIQLPEAAKAIHSIKTDDPSGIESYWHRRFAQRRKNGEWFELTAEDISAFKRRKFM